MTYYHGGVPGLLPGQMILPPTETGAPSSADFTDDQAKAALVRRDRVYATTDLASAKFFAWAYFGERMGDVYEVELLGKVEPDADWLGEPGGSMCAERAQVIRLVLPGVPGLGVNYRLRHLEEAAVTAFSSRKDDHA